VTVRVAQSPVARGEREQVFAGGAVLGRGFLEHHPQNFAVALGRDRQPVLEIPGRKAAFGRIVTQLDLAAFQRLPVGSAEDRQQHAAAGAIGQLVPVDIEGCRVR